MTIHAAKGLEFSRSCWGMEEDLFPSMLSKNSRAIWKKEDFM